MRLLELAPVIAHAPSELGAADRDAGPILHVAEQPLGEPQNLIRIELAARREDQPRRDHLVAQPTPQALFDRPQIRCLPHERASMHVAKLRKKMRIMTLKVLKQGFILAQAQVISHDFHRHDFAIGQPWGRTARSQLVLVGNHWHHLVNQTKTCDNKIVQVHGVPPQVRFSVF